MIESIEVEKIFEVFNLIMSFLNFIIQNSISLSTKLYLLIYKNYLSITNLSKKNKLKIWYLKMQNQILKLG